MSKSQRKQENKIIIVLSKKVAKGHQNHISGSGTHNDRRTKRLRTRAAQLKYALSL